MHRLALVGLLLSTVAAAEPVVITPSTVIRGVAAEDWRHLYDSAVARAGDIKARLGGDLDILRRPLTQEEEQCLLNRAIRGEGQGLLDIMQQVGGADASMQAAIARIVHALGGTGGDDWCNRPGPTGRNRGLSLWSASLAAPGLDVRVADAVRAKVDALKGRPLTWAEAVGIAGAVAFGVGALAVP